MKFKKKTSNPIEQEYYNIIDRTFDIFNLVVIIDSG